MRKKKTEDALTFEQMGEKSRLTRKEKRPIDFSQQGIIPLSTPGMAPNEPFKGPPASTKETVFLQRLDGILRTGGLEATGRGQNWGKKKAVEADEEDGDVLHWGCCIKAEGSVVPAPPPNPENGL
jgi:hypothetical protein